MKRSPSLTLRVSVILARVENKFRRHFVAQDTRNSNQRERGISRDSLARALALRAPLTDIFRRRKHWPAVLRQRKLPKVVRSLQLSLLRETQFVVSSAASRNSRDVQTRRDRKTPLHR